MALRQSNRATVDVISPRRVGRALRGIDAHTSTTLLPHGHNGNAPLRSILNDHFLGTTPTRNDLEEAFLAICDKAHLPRPEVNVCIPMAPTPYEADFLWRTHRLIAETDGRDAHTTRRAFEHDRRRDQQLMLAGYRVVRFPRRQVYEDPASVDATLRGLLKRPAPV